MKVPRLQGKIGVLEEPPEWKGQFGFEIYLTFMGEGRGNRMGLWAPFKTEQEARVELRKVSREMSETIEMEMTGKISGQYLDMKTNEMRNWEEH